MNYGTSSRFGTPKDAFNASVILRTHPVLSCVLEYWNRSLTVTDDIELEHEDTMTDEERILTKRPLSSDCIDPFEKRNQR